MKKYIAECRYEWLSSEGKIWSEWFPMASVEFDDVDMKQTLKDLAKSTADIDRKTKMKHEYRAMLSADYEKYLSDIKKKAVEAVEDFKTIKKMKRPWANKSRKMIRELRAMSNAEKVEWKAKRNKEVNI